MTEYRGPLVSRHRPHLLLLEPRMMFDAAAAVVAQGALAASEATLHAPSIVDTSGDAAHPALATGHGPHAPVHLPVAEAEVAARTTERTPALVDAPTPSTPSTATGHDVIFIDTAVDDYRQLAAEWAGRGQIVLIDSSRDGIAQMQAALAGQSDVDAIHIVSHGSEGVFWLGTTRVDQAAITGTLASALGAIGSALHPGGDILVYGCDFAEGADGASALNALAAATHADVAASTDPTGYAGRGADWTLEAHVGTIDARALDSADWVHTLDPNTPIPISVTADSLTVKNGAGTVVVDGTTGYGSDARSPDVGVGAVAIWHGAATFQGQAVDLVATVVSISAGDAIRFNRPTGTGMNGDDPTFLLRDLTTANDATVQIRWSLVLASTGAALPADVRFTIADIDGIGGNPNTRESVTAATTGLAYYTREKVTDINFVSSLDNITASGTQDENTVAGQPLSPASAATFDWSAVSSFTLTYKLTTNSVTKQAQFYHDGDADFVYSDPVYVSIPRLDLDKDDSTAPGNDAHFTFTEHGPPVPIVDSDVVVSNPMSVDSITGATVKLENYKAGDTFTVGTLPSNITATIGAVTSGTVTITLSGTGSESDYDAAFRAIGFSNTSSNPDTTQRVIDIAFSNDTLTSATATSRIDIIPVNDPPTAVNDSATTNEDTAVTIAVLANDTDPEGDALTVTSASALHGAVVCNADGTVTYTPNANYNGSDTISYAISDGHGGTSSATVAVTINPVNDAPTPVGTLPARNAVDAATVSYATAGGFTDVDGDTLTYSATGLPAGLTIDAGTGVISGTLDRSASQANGGSYAVIVTARDPSNTSAMQNFTLTVTNPAPIAADDSATTNEDTSVTIAVLANDHDPDGDPLTITSATALHGNVAINADGTLSYTPNANYNGSDTISYAISDGQGGTSSAHVAVTINPVNDAPTPVGTLPARNAMDAATVSYATASGFTDMDGDTLTYSATGLPSGLTIDPASGVISGTLDRSASQANGGSYAVIVTARDPSNTSATQNFTLTVTNPAPTAVDDSATTNEDTAVTIAVLANDHDPDGDPLTVTSASALHGSVVRNADGTLSYTPNANYNGSDTISYAISDGQGGTSSAHVAVTVTPVNDPPMPVGTLPAQSTLDGSSVRYATASGFSDVDGDALAYSATGLPAGLSIDAGTGVISGTLDRSASQANGGHYTVTVTARDPSDAAATQAFTIDVGNPAPNAADDAVTTHVDTPVTIAVLSNDHDPDGDPLTVTSASGAIHGSVAINADGTLRYTPDAGYAGTDTLHYTISDGQGGTASATVTITIANAAPVAAAQTPVSAQDGQAITLPLGPRFTDPDGDTLTFSATGLPAGLSIDPATGTVHGTIDHAASASNGGVYDSVVTANDGHGGTTSTVLHWTVTNPPPTARDDAATTAEDSSIVIVVLANDSDPDGDPLSVVSASAAHGSALVNPDGTITYMPAPDFNGRDTIVYTIDDGNGGRSTASVAVTVTPVNDAPTTAGLPPRSTPDGAGVSVPIAPSFGDVDGDTLTYSATGLPPGLAIDPATGVISGTIAPGSAYGGPAADGVYHAVVTATDPSGAKATAPFDWSVAQTAPVARDDHATTPEDTPVTIAVLANDTDADNDPLTIVSATSTHGSVYIQGGALVFYPAPDFNGVATIAYTIADPAGNRSTATVTIDVTPVNDAPVASPLPAANASDAQTVSLDLGGFFRDPDGDTLTFAASGLPAGLVIDPATGRISGTVDHQASQMPGGVYHVTVTATDPSGASDRSSFDWTIVNPAPVARDDAATTAEDTAIVIPVLANDRDPDGDTLTVMAANAGHGSVAIGPDGRLTYTPDPDFNGNDVIVYTIDDGNGGRATASVLVTITPVNDAPVTVQPHPADAAATDAAPLAIDTAPWFHDVDGDALAYSATGLPPGLSIDAATGAIRGTIDHSASQTAGGVYAVTVTARDPSGAGTSANFDIRVTNPAPIARNDAASTLQDGAGIVIPVLANDADPDGDPIHVVTAVADHGTATINPDGTVTYVPGATFAGADTVRYTISDGEGGTAAATVAITVVPVEHPPVAGTLAPVDATGGRPVGIAVLPAATDPDGDRLTVTAATTATGTVIVNPDNTISYTPPLGFVGTASVGYTISDGRGGTATGTLVVRVTQGRAADVEQLLRIGRVTFRDPTPSLATVTVTDGTIRSPLSLLDTVDGIRSLRDTKIGTQPVGDAVEAIQSLRGTRIDPDTPILAEVARLDAIRDQRDVGDRLFDERWGDFLAKGLTGFSVAADAHAGIMIDSVVHGGAIYLDISDTATDGRCAIARIDIRLGGGGRVPDWITVDPRGMAIIERGADMDELHLVVRVTRTDGRTTATPIVVQGETGEVELDRHDAPRPHAGHARPHAAPLDATLRTPSSAIHAEAARLSSYFQ